MAVSRAFQCGFEQGIAELNAFVGSSASPAVSSTKARTGSWSLRSPTISNDPFKSGGCAISPATQLRAFASFNHNGLYSGSSNDSRVACLFRLQRANGTFIIFGWHGVSFVLTSTEAGTVTAPNTTGGWTATDTWHDASIDVKIDATEGWLKLHINGVETIAYTGNTGTSPIVAVCVLGNTNSLNAIWGNYAYVDDFYCDITEGEESAPASSRRFFYQPVSGNGTKSEWTGSDADSTDNYLLVDDAAGSTDEDTTFVAASAADLEDLYAIGDFSLPSDWIPRAVIPVAIARKTDLAADIQLAMQLHKGGNTSTAAAQSLSTVYGQVFGRFTALPDGSALADVSNISVCEAGPLSAGTFT